VASLSQLVASPTLSSLLGYVARPRSDAEVERVALIEDLGDIERVAEGAIVLLTRSASAAAGTYRFDMALRMGRGHRIAALVLPASEVARMTPTAAAVADRSGTALLGTSDDVDLGELAIAIARELSGGADAALMRAHAAVRAVAAHPPDGNPELLVERAGAALGVQLSLVSSEPASGPRTPVVLGDHVEGWLSAPQQEGDLAMALEIVMHVAAAGVRRALARARRAEELPIQSQAELLSELLSASQQGRARIVQRGRDLGVPIDGWHVAVRVEFEDLTDPGDGRELAAFESRLGVARALMRAVRGSGGTWYGAPSGTALVLVRMYGADPGAAASAEVGNALDEALAEARGRVPTTLMRCGVGSPHPGPEGLLSSAAEAKAAVTAARAAGAVYSAVPFDSVGLRRALVEWYASDIAQEAVTTVLAPLAKLGGVRGERLIQTLHVYLDHQGSLTKTAEALNLHRNAVAYRIKNAFALLDVDPDNPDDLLLLQLACRARELS
jgi:PucR C-terminal helix-turn-helix domain/GGDEF-like domain